MMTSPNLNYLLIIGAILLYLSVIFWMLPAKEEMKASILCNVRKAVFALNRNVSLSPPVSFMAVLNWQHSLPGCYLV